MKLSALYRSFPYFRSDKNVQEPEKGTLVFLVAFFEP